MVRVRAHNINMIVSTIFSELLIPAATRLSFMVHHHKLEYLIKRLDCFVQCQDHRKPFVTKLGMMLHHHELKCHAKRLAISLLAIFVVSVLSHTVKAYTGNFKHSTRVDQWLAFVDVWSSWHENMQKSNCSRKVKQQQEKWCHSAFCLLYLK